MASTAELIAMAQSAPYVAPYDYRKQPLGSVAGEEGLAVPYNAVGEAVVHVRNWSALHARKVLLEAVSPQRGGARSTTTKGSPFFGKTPEELQRIVKDEGRDMNWYDIRIDPVSFGLRFDGEVIEIKPDLEEVDIKDKETGEYHTEKQPVWRLVPPGAWDLYMGNWDRMHSSHIMERTREMEALNNRGLSRFVLRSDNDFGFLEFKREEVKYEVQRLDRAKLAGSSIIEV